MTTPLLDVRSSSSSSENTYADKMQESSLQHSNFKMTLTFLHVLFHFSTFRSLAALTGLNPIKTTELNFIYNKSNILEKIFKIFVGAVIRVIYLLHGVVDLTCNIRSRQTTCDSKQDDLVCSTRKIHQVSSSCSHAAHVTCGCTS